MGMVPLVAERSEWQTPQAPTLIITSPRLGASTVISSTTTGLFNSRQRTARAFRDILNPLSFRASSIAGRQAGLFHPRPGSVLRSKVAHQAESHPSQQHETCREHRPEQPFLSVGLGGERAEEARRIAQQGRRSTRDTGDLAHPRELRIGGPAIAV